MGVASCAVSPNGLLGDEMIQDTHHPTLRGYVTLAGAVLRELARRRTFDLLSTIELPLDCGECADQFGMGADAWATVCDRTSEHYRRVAGYRYDPAERLDKSRRYAEAARKIRAGIPIEDFGLPGIAFSASSIPPGTSLDHVVYDSFGNIVTETNPSNGDRFKFAGMEYDTAVGQYYDRGASR